MAVVRNLMLRVGADFSAARKELQNATRELGRFRRDTERTVSTIGGKKGFQGIGAELRNLSRDVTSSLSQIRGASGIGGVVVALSTLRPFMSQATKGLSALRVAAGGTGAAFGAAVAGVGALVAILGIATMGIYQASQAAVKFEADVGRLSMQIGKNTKDFLDWSRSIGLAKTTAVEMGATYSTLLSSFIRDSRELTEQTKQLIHTTNVVASATGRNIEDVMERMRSGILGNTEAIEDLGIFVNVAMIESTEAFRRFAGDKSWNQLTFQQQQQIRLAAILEQAYKRYGNEIQQNVMARQSVLLEQFKDIRLHLSQAFMPIWDAVLPALIRLGQVLSWITEQIARFMYWLRGWDYDEMAQGMAQNTERATDSLEEQGESFDDLAKSAQKATKQLAAFDEINQLIFDTAGDAGGGRPGSTPGDGSFPTLPGGSSAGGGAGVLPELPPLPRFRIEFDPPFPPDAGLGAVVTTAIATVETLIAELRIRFATIEELWAALLENMLGTATVIFPQVRMEVAGFGQEVESVAQPVTNLGSTWLETLNNMVSQATTVFPQLRAELANLDVSLRNVIPSMENVGAFWSTFLATMLARLKVHRASIAAEWEQLKTTLMTAQIPLATIGAMWALTLTTMLDALRNFLSGFSADWKKFHDTILSLSVPLQVLNTMWAATLAEMLATLEAHLPAFAAGFAHIGLSALALVPQIDELRRAWSSALQQMMRDALSYINPILAKLQELITMWATAKAVMDEEGEAPNVGAILRQVGASVVSALSAVNREVNAFFDSAANALSLGLYNRLLEKNQQQERLEAQQGLSGTLGSIIGNLLGGLGLTGAAKGALKYADNLVEWLSNLFKGTKAVPQMAAGGIVYGPTLAMIGEAGKEAVIPLEDTSFVDTLASAIGTAVVSAQQVAQGGGLDTAQNREIVIQIDGRELARVLYPYQQEEQRRRGTSVIRPV